MRKEQGSRQRGHHQVAAAPNSGHHHHREQTSSCSLNRLVVAITVRHPLKPAPPFQTCVATLLIGQSHQSRCSVQVMGPLSCTLQQRLMQLHSQPYLQPRQCQMRPALLPVLMLYLVRRQQRRAPLSGRGIKVMQPVQPCQHMMVLAMADRLLMHATLSAHLHLEVPKWMPHLVIAGQLCARHETWLHSSTFCMHAVSYHSHGCCWTLNQHRLLQRLWRGETQIGTPANLASSEAQRLS